MPLLYAIFIFSGAAGLIYETVWPRYIKLLVGHSAYAQVIVLSIFLGGMAIGAMIISKYATKIKNPLKYYAGIELIVGIIGLLFHQLYELIALASYNHLLNLVSDSIFFTPAKWTLAASMILPQSILLGATFPLMSAGVIRLTGRHLAGSTLGMLYFSNSFGAAIGCLVAGFYLIPKLGLPGCSMLAGTLNIMIAIVVYYVGDKVPNYQTESSVTDQHQVDPLMCQPSRLGKILLCLSFGTAAASFIYEIAWLRMLALVLGSSTHTFELMLSAFILGLAFGGLFIHTYIDKMQNPMLSLSIIQWVMGLTAILTIPIYLNLFNLTSSLFQTFQATNSGYVGFTLSRYFVSLAIMLPSTFCAGMTLPLITQILFRTPRGEKAIGQVYGINTLGSIFGVLLGSMVLLPTLGLKKLMIFGGSLDMLLGIGLLYVLLKDQRKLAYGFTAITASFVTLLLIAFPFKPTLLSSGVFHQGYLLDELEWQNIYYEDGRTSTVSVLKNQEVFVLSNNGTPDASLSSSWVTQARTGQVAEDERPFKHDESTQALLALIPLAFKADASNAAVIGHGFGMTSHLLLASDQMTAVETIEIEPRVYEGAKAIYPVNKKAYDDPRSTLIVDDAKAHFSAGKRIYDIVISEPSNPWVSGVSSLFTLEFYQRIQHHLSDDGVFAQWLQLYEINDDLSLSVLAAISRVFPNISIYQVSRTAIVILASKENPLNQPNWQVFQLPEIRRDFHGVTPIQPTALEQLRWYETQDLIPMLEHYHSVNSDFFPILENGAERTRFLHDAAYGLFQYSEGSYDLYPALKQRLIPFMEPEEKHAFFFGRYAAQQKAAWLRKSFLEPENKSFSAILPVATEELHQVQRFAQNLSNGQAPSSWKHWTKEAHQIYNMLHQGSNGVAFDAFFEQAEAYLIKYNAPQIDFDCLKLWQYNSKWAFVEALPYTKRVLAAAANGDVIIDQKWLYECAGVIACHAGVPQLANHYFQQREQTAFRKIFISTYCQQNQ